MLLKLVSKATDTAKEKAKEVAKTIAIGAAGTAAGTAVACIVLAEISPLLANVLTSLIVGFGKMMLMSTISYLGPWLLIAALLYIIGNAMCECFNFQPEIIR